MLDETNEFDIKKVIKRYALSTVFFYGIAIALLSIGTVMDSLIGMLLFFGMPPLNALLSSKIAIRKHVIKYPVMGKVMLVNLLTHGLLILVMLILSIALESIGPLLGVMIGFFFGLLPALISYDIFRDKKHAVKTESHETPEDDLVTTVEEEEKLAEIEAFLKNPQAVCSRVIGGWYISIMIITVSLGHRVLSLVDDIFNDISSLIGFLILLLPTMGVVISCCILRKLNVRQGDRLLRHIMRINGVIYFLLVLFTDITSFFIWVTLAIAFIPTIIMSYLIFKRIEDKAIHIKDIHGNVINFREAKIQDGITDASFREFLCEIGLGSLDYFYGVYFNGEMEAKQVRYGTHYMVAFDEDQLYFFEVYGKKIAHLSVAPKSIVGVIRQVKMKNKRRIALGILGMFQLEVRFDAEGLAYQELMLERFVSKIDGEEDVLALLKY